MQGAAAVLRPAFDGNFLRLGAAAVRGTAEPNWLTRHAAGRQVQHEAMFIIFGTRSCVKEIGMGRLVCPNWFPCVFRNRSVMP
jgi:hypothetical protein